jgi:hypothetical protein
MELFGDAVLDLAPEETIRRMSPAIRGFLSDALEECPEFMDAYLIPVLSGYECPEDKIIHDLCGAFHVVELEDMGLSGDDTLYGLGELSGVLKKIKKAVKKVAHKVIAPVKKVIEKITPKPILNIEKKVAKSITKVGKEMQRVEAKVQKVEGKIGKKYGDLIITAAGVVLAPFTGGASIAAASALVAAHKAYTAKRNADQAKKLGKAQAAQIQQQATADQTAASQQMDQFFQQNQEWFAAHGITPDQWASMTFDQKVAAINAGAAGGGAAAQQPVTQPYTGDGSQPASGGGGGGGTSSGGGGGGGDAGGGASYGAAPGKPGVATASMFDSSMLPLLAGGAILALMFGKPVKDRGRARRNPSRRYRRAVA